MGWLPAGLQRVIRSKTAAWGPTASLFGALRAAERAQKQGPRRAAEPPFQGMTDGSPLDRSGHLGYVPSSRLALNPIKC